MPRSSGRGIFLPEKMCKDVLKALEFSWKQDSRSLERETENYLLQINDYKTGGSTSGLLPSVPQSELPGTRADGEILALKQAQGSRTLQACSSGSKQPCGT